MCDDTIDETFTDALLAAGDRNDDGHHVNVGGDNRLISGVSPTRSLLSGSLNPELKVCGGGDDTDKHSDAESSYTTDYSDSVIGGLGLANTVSLNISISLFELTCKNWKLLIWTIDLFWQIQVSFVYAMSEYAQLA